MKYFTAIALLSLSVTVSAAADRPANDLVHVAEVFHTQYEVASSIGTTSASIGMEESENKFLGEVVDNELTHTHHMASGHSSQNDNSRMN